MLSLYKNNFVYWLWMWLYVSKSFETQRIDFNLIKVVDSEKLEIVKENFNFPYNYLILF